MKTLLLNSVLLLVLLVSYVQPQSRPSVLKDNLLFTADSSLAIAKYQKAMSFLNEANYDSSLFFFEEASKLFEKAHDANRAAICNIEIGKIYMRSADYSRASEKLQATLKTALSDSNISQKTLSRLYNALGTLNKNLVNLKQSLIFYKKALALHVEEFGENNSRTGELYYNIGNIFLHMNSLDEAQKYYKKAMRIFKLSKGEHSFEFGKSLIGYGNLMLRVGKYSRAIASYDSSIIILSKFKKRRIEIAIANNHSNLGIAFWYLGYLDKSLKEHFKALKMRRSLYPAAHPQIAISYTNIAIVYDEMEQYEKAKTFYHKALDIFINKYGENHPYVAQTYNNLGVCLSNDGDYSAAIECYKKDIAALTVLGGKNNPDLVGNYLNIASAQTHLKNWDAALRYCKMAEKINLINKRDTHPSWITINQNLGNLYLEQKKFNNALKYYKKALANIEQNKDVSIALKADILTNMGSVYYEMGNLVKAKALFKKTLQVYLGNPKQNKSKLSGIYYNIGNIFQKRKDLASALNYYKKALQFLLDGTQHYDICKQISFSNPSASLAAIPILMEIARIKQKKCHSVQGQADNSSLLIYKNISALIDNLRNSYKNKESKIFLEESVSKIYEKAIVDMVNLSKEVKDKRYKEAAFFFSEKNKSNLLENTIQDSYARHFAGIPDSLLEQVNNESANIAYFETALQKEKNKTTDKDSVKISYFENRLFNVKREYEQLIKRMETDFPLYHQIKYANQPVTITDLQKKLDINSVFLEYSLSDSLLDIFVVSADSYDVFQLNVPTDIATDIQKLTRAVKKYDKETYVKYSYRMYRTLIQPIEKEIRGKDHLIIIPDGALYYLPFEILLTEQPLKKNVIDFNGLSYLLKKYQVSYHYSATLFARSAEQKSLTARPKGLAAFAPVFDEKEPASLLASRSQNWSRSLSDATLRKVFLKNQRFRPLPNSEEEVQSICSMFEEHNRTAKLYLRKDANEQNFKKYVSGYKFVHVATHGLINEKYPRLSGIAFYQPKDTISAEDGILYSSENYALNVSADLLVLSSCESGLGKLIKGEGLISLTRGFFYAGARNIVVSLWKVSDKATAELMKHFYYYILRGNSYAASLRKAKLELIKDQNTAFPRSWASFILLGR